jgi:hypothetical protein
MKLLKTLVEWALAPETFLKHTITPRANSQEPKASGWQLEASYQF